MRVLCSVLSVLLCVSSVFSFGQQRSAYYDALYLKKQFEKNKSIKVEPSNRELFDYYFGKRASDDELGDSINVNPFLKEYYNSELAQGLFNESIEKGINNLGSLNVTNIADGLARFLIKRGKEELNVAFFNRMKKFLDDPDHPEVKTLFPITVEFLTSIEAYRYAELIQSLREAFHKDLANLLVNVNELIDQPKYKKILKELPEIRAAIRTSKIVSELSQSDEGVLPDALIHELASLEEWEQINSNLGNAWKLLDIISQSIRYIPATDPAEVSNSNIVSIDTIIQKRRVFDTIVSGRHVSDTTIISKVIAERLVNHFDAKQQNKMPANTMRWIKLSDFNKLLNDKIALKIFIGLVYEKVKTDKIQFTVKRNSVFAYQFMSDHADVLSVVSGLIEEFAILASDVDRTIKDFKDKRSNGTLTNDDYYQYIGKAINLTEYGFKVAGTITENKIDDKYIAIARNGNEMYKNIYTKNYSNAIMNAYKILNQAFVKLQEDESTPQAGKDLLKSSGIQAEIIEKILKYGNFMALIVKAESGEDVEKALDAVTLPAGSYSIKQKAAINISVNGYIGYAWDMTKVSFFRNIHARGVYAPVGISLSRGSRYNRPTFSAFVSIIDVGGIAAYRLENGNNDALKQEVRLESIFSPSAQVVIEPFSGFPLAIATGWRRTPKLFYSNNAITVAEKARSVFNISILIDIPLFNIVNKPFEKK